MTGGFWKDEKRTGAYRVLILNEGHESIRYHAVLQWIEDAEGGPRVTATKRLNPLAKNCFSLLEPTFKLQDGKWSLVLRGSSAPMKQASQPVEFAFGKVGQVTAGKVCAPAF